MRVKEAPHAPRHGRLAAIEIGKIRLLLGLGEIQRCQEPRLHE